MLRASSWRTEGRVRHDRIDLFLFGPSGVGITTLIASWMQDRQARTLVLDDRKKLLRVRKVRDETELTNYIRISQNRPHGVMFLFDVCRTESFVYMIALLEKMKPVFNSNTVRYLVGTKRDTRSESDDDVNQVSIQDAVMLAMRNLMRYRETSSISSEGVQGAFMSIINDTHQLGLRLEEQSMIANLGSYMSLPRKGGNKDVIVDFERKRSIDSDTSECSSDLSYGSDIDDFIRVSLNQSGCVSLAEDSDEEPNDRSSSDGASSTSSNSNNNKKNNNNNDGDNDDNRYPVTDSSKL